MPGRRRNFPLLLGALFVSTVGDWLYRLALPILVLTLTGSALSTGIVYTIEYLPYLLFSVLGGLAADRFDRRRLLIVTDAGSAVVVGTLAVLIWLHLHPLWAIYLVAFLLAGGRPFYHPAFQSIIPQLVSDRDLPTANSRLQTAQALLELAGPVLGGGVVVALGVANSLTLDAISFALSAAAIALMRLSRVAPPASGRSSPLHDLVEAFAYLRQNAPLLAGALLLAGNTFGEVLVESGLVFYLVALKGNTVATVGIVLGASGAGSVAGAWLAPRFSAVSTHPGRVILVCMLAAGGATGLLIPLTGVPGIALAWAIVGGSSAVIRVTWFTLRQRTVPGYMLGRVVALTRMIAWASLPVAPVVGGVILNWSHRALLLIAIATAAHLAVALGGWFTALRRAGESPGAARGGVAGAP